MAAATKDRNTQCRFLGPEYVNVPVKAAATIYEGTLVCVDSSGYAHPGADTSGYKVIGVAEEKSEAVTGESDGDRVIKVRTGVHKLANSSGAPVVAATIGRLCYVADDQTVAASDSNNVVAGIAMEIDEDLGIWVDVSNYAAFATVAGYVGWGAIETVTSGALDPDKRTTKLSCTGTKAYTLAAGAIEGQRKTVVCSVAASTPRGTLTPATGDVFTFDGVGQWAEYEYHASGGWVIVARGDRARDYEVVTGAGAIDPNVRTTLLSVTGTVAYTLADGSYEGQRKTIRCVVAASTPAGTVTPATASGTYAADSIAFDAITDFVELEWHAGGWIPVLYTAAVTVS